MTPKERIYAILRGGAYDRPAVTPIFMAWAAGFVGRTYRDYYLDGDVLVEAQLAVTRAFNLDQVSAISDPWREASAYGMEFDYPEHGVGKPRQPLIGRPEDVTRVGLSDIENAPRPRQRIESIRKMAEAIGSTHSVLGWVEGPIALYADLRGVESMFLDLIDNPRMYLQAAESIVENQIRFALAQVSAGADMIGVGDSVASLISPQLYRYYVVPF
jgi:uroporphyrinogen-III decarboxylase